MKATIAAITAALSLPAVNLATAGPVSDGDSAGELGEIVVTAEKTTEPLSKTPISISAVSSATLEEQHITDYEELSRAVPNLSYSSFGGPGQANIEIRGVASQAGSATTGIYLNIHCLIQMGRLHARGPNQGSCAQALTINVDTILIDIRYSHSRHDFHTQCL